MARIRTIKPEFFTSMDIVGLTPLARLLYIATWCEADREGRFKWSIPTLKIRYFPADSCDVDALARELVASGLVKLYGEGLAYIPSFKVHQFINNRESESVFPSPHQEEGKERKGKEGRRVKDASARVTDASTSFTKPEPEEIAAYATEIGVDIDPQRFCDFYESKGWKIGKAGMKDWQAAVRNWVRNSQPSQRKSEVWQ